MNKYRYLSSKAAHASTASQPYSRSTMSRVARLCVRRYFHNSSPARDTTDTTTEHSNRPPVPDSRHTEETSRREQLPLFSLLEQQLTSVRRAKHFREQPFTNGPLPRLWRKEDYHLFGNLVPPLVATSAYGDVVLSEFPETQLDDNKNLQRLKTAIKLKDPHLMLAALIKLVSFDGQKHFTSEPLHSLPPTMFSEILRCIHPRFFLQRYASLLRELDRGRATLLGIPIHTYYSFIPIFLSQIQGIITARGSSHPLSLLEFTYLLTCARETGRGDVADAVWKRMQSQGVAPDIECYNQLMATKCWKDLMTPEHRQMLRVTKGRLILRGWYPEWWYNLKGHKSGNSGIRIQIANIFRSMAKAGISGNEETFCLIMVGLGREGDINGVESVLKSVWEVDVAAVMSQDRQPKPKYLDKDSPLYPSQELMQTLAHVYGTNNDVPKALRLLDYFSQQYTVTISSETWEELLTRTVVLSARRAQRSRRPAHYGELEGQLPNSAVTALWKTMTSEPYNVVPTMSMYNLHILKLISIGFFTYARRLMEEGLDKHRQIVAILNERNRYRQIVIRKGSKADIHKITRDLQFLKLRVRRNRLYIKVWVEALLKGMHDLDLKHSHCHATQELPNILKYWELFLPWKIKGIEVSDARYDIKTHSGAINALRQMHTKEKKQAGHSLPMRVESYHQRRQILRQKKHALVTKKCFSQKKIFKNKHIDQIAADGEARDLLLYAER